MDFISFYLFFFLFQDSILVTTLHLVILPSLVPLSCDGFSDLPCFWWRWQFWGVLGYIADCLCIGIYLMFSFMIREVTCFGEENHKCKVPFSSQHIKGTYTYYQNDYHCCCWFCSFGWSSRFHHCKVTLPSSTPFIPYSLKGNNCIQSTLKEWGVLPLLENKVFIWYLKCFCTGDLFFFPFIIYSIIFFLLVWTRGHLFYYLSYIV